MNAEHGEAGQKRLMDILSWRFLFPSKSQSKLTTENTK